jgi:hypothetical protein
MKLKNKVREFTIENAPKERAIKMEVQIRMTLGNGVKSDTYYSGTELCEIRIDKKLISTTDTNLKDLKDEILSCIQTQLEDLEKQIENSPKLTDEFWVDKEQY